MSAAEATTIAQTRRRPSTRFLRSELRLLFGRRRNQLALLVLAGPPLLISIAVRSSVSQPGRDAPDFFSSITQNGLFVALAAMTIEMTLFLPLATAAAAGDAIAGEANTGTLRYLLTVPVGRIRLLMVKFAGVVVFVLAAVFVVSVVGMAMGLILFGGGDLTTLSGSQLGMGTGIVRVIGATVYLGLSLTALGAIGLFLSTLTEQPVAAMLATIVISTASFILDAIPQVGFLHPYLLTHHWAAYGDLLRDPVSWAGIEHGLYCAAAYVVVFLLAAWARLSTKDITS